MAFTQPRPFMTPKEVAKALGGRANRETVIRLINNGVLKGKKLGREYRIRPEWLEEYMSQHDEIPIRK